MADLSLTKFPCWILGSCLILASSMIPGRCFLYFTLNFHAVATLSYDFERDDTLTFLADVLVSLLSVQSRSARSPWLPMLLIECRVMNTCIYVPIDLLNSCLFFYSIFSRVAFWTTFCSCPIGQSFFVPFLSPLICSYDIYSKRFQFQIHATILQDDEEKVEVEESFLSQTLLDDTGKLNSEAMSSGDSTSSTFERWIIKLEQSINIFLTVFLHLLLS